MPRIFSSSLCALVAIAISLFSGVTIGMEGSVSVPTTDYDNVTSAELISVYRQAYKKAGFKLKVQTTRQEKGVGGRKITRLVFEFLNLEKPGGKKGIVAFVISAPASESCAPCSVIPEALGPDPTVQDPALWSAIYERTLSADSEASAEIKKKLGKSVR